MSDLTRAARPFHLLLAALVALLLHALAVQFLFAIFPDPAPDDPKATTVTPVELIEEDPDQPQEQQVVSLDKPDQDSPPPDEARHLDRYNQQVEQETQRARDGRQEGAPAIQARPSDNPQPPSPRPSPTTPTPGAPPTQDKDAQPQQDAQPLPEREDAPDKAPTGPEKTTDSPSQNTLERAADNNPTLGDPALPGKTSPPGPPGEQPEVPKLDAKDILPNMERMLGEGGSGPKDYLDVPEGDKDLLNRKQTRYWAFFDRMKESVRRKWSPMDVYRLHDPRRQIYGVEDRLTVLSVTLNGDGSLHQILIEKPSGVPFLDDEAMRAFRAASPFPNPPEGLKDKNGLISLRFGFFLDIQSSGARIIRFRR
jgi:TonB family protein